MDNYDKEIYNFLNKIIYDENIILLKKIAKDFNRDERKLIDNYKKKLYK
jgi:hypothetical protein